MKVKKLLGVWIDGKYIEFDEMKMKYVRTIMKCPNIKEFKIEGHTVITNWIQYDEE